MTDAVQPGDPGFFTMLAASGSLSAAARVRFGEPPGTRVATRRLAPNRRLPCASPACLARRSTPATPSDLAKHHCIGIRQGDNAYGVWQLTGKSGAARNMESVHIDGNLTTNDGEITVKSGARTKAARLLLRMEHDKPIRRSDR